MSTKNKIEKLIHEISIYDHAYWVDNNSLVSDTFYDQKLAELRKLEESDPTLVFPYSPTQRIYKNNSSTFEQVIHSSPMLSLENAFDAADLKRFFKRTQTNNYHLEYKFDGLAVSLVYENGILVQASTRGDGTTGDNILRNIRTLKTVPLKLLNSTDSIEVRGEVLILKKDFEKLSKTHFFSNARNAAAGSLKLLDSEKVAERRLTFFAYDILGKNECKLQTQVYQLLQWYGFQVSRPLSRYVPVTAIEAEISSIEKSKKDLNFEIDGVVIKVNDRDYAKKLGYTAKAPKASIAWKFTEELFDTELLGIEWQIGRLGTITPVAILSPVSINGSVISKATLHNIAEIKRLGIKLHDRLYIKKAGEVIPKIVSKVPVLETTGTTTSVSKALVTIDIPDICPCCKTALVETDSGLSKYCPNYNCSERIKQRITHFASRSAMDIMGLSSKIIGKLVDLYGIHEGIELYDLDALQIAKATGGMASARKIYDEIQQSKTQPWERVIIALGIPGVGRASARKYAKTHSLEAIKKELDFPICIKPYIQAGLNTEPKPDPIETGFLFKHETVVFTGKLHYIKREVAQQLVLQNGGNIGSSVSHNTTLLVVGEKAGSKKAKATELGISIMTEEEFLTKCSLDNNLANFC